MKKLLPLLLVVSFGACVSTAKFRSQEAAAAAQKARAEDLEAKLKSAEGSLAEAAKAAEAQKAALELSEKSNTELKDSLASSKTALGQKVSSLIGERDALQKDRDALARERAALGDKLAAAQAQNAELAKKLADAETAEKGLVDAKKALEDQKNAELLQLKKSYEDMTAGLKSEIANGQVQITQLQGKLTVNLVDQILFDSGSAEVKGDGKKVLSKVADALNKIADKDIRIEGHTDNKPLSAALQSKFPSNWELSTARATSVARYLQDHAKVTPERLIAAGYGEFHPKVSNETPEGRAKNRRIEIVLAARE
jgi:chemotaxis protein MotB